MECFGLEGTFKGHLAQHLCSEQGHLQLDQVAQSPVQPDLERFQIWGLHYLSVLSLSLWGKPVWKAAFSRSRKGKVQTQRQGIALHSIPEMLFCKG